MDLDFEAQVNAMLKECEDICLKKLGITEPITLVIPKVLMEVETKQPDPLPEPIPVLDLSVLEIRPKRGRPRESQIKQQAPIPLNEQLMAFFAGNTDLNMTQKPRNSSDYSYAVVYSCKCGKKYAVVSNVTPAQYLAGMRYQLKTGKSKNEFFDHIRSGCALLPDYHVDEEFPHKLTSVMAHQYQKSLALKYDTVNKPATLKPVGPDSSELLRC